MNVALYLTAISVQKHYQKSILQTQIVLTVDPKTLVLDIEVF